MRIHSVEMAGFGPFLAPQRVDFEVFADHGIFLVQGRTGAGKSSILDAVVYALYNSAPRYGTRAAEQLRSHHCAPHDQTWVQLEFTVDGERHRLRRSPEFERPKSRGEGLTTERAAATLWRLDRGDWVALDASPRAVAQRLDDLLPFSLAQFLQVVMLAQGQFERFLVAESAERKKLLGKLFDTRRFDDLDVVLQERVATRRAVLDRAASTSDALLTTLAGHLGVELPQTPDAEWLEVAVTSCATAATTATSVRDAAQARLELCRGEVDTLRDLRSRQIRRDELRRSHAALTAERDEIEVERARLARAAAARAVRSGREDHQRSGVRLAECELTRDKASALFGETFGEEVPDTLDLRRDELIATIPSVERAAEAEERLVRGAAEIDRCRLALVDLDRDEERLAQECVLHQEVAARPLEADPDEVERSVHDLVAQVARASRHHQAVESRRLAEAAALAAGEQRTGASARLDDLRRRSLEQVAGRLAETLVDGEACQVCGSTVHPAPATSAADRVQDADLERAQEEFDRAQGACVKAEGDVAAAKAQEAAYSGPLDLDQARALLAEVTQRQQRVRDAVQARAEAEKSLAEAAEARQHAAVRRASLLATVESRTEALEDLKREVDLARQGAESVAERLDGLRHHLRVVEEVLAAGRALDRVAGEHRAAAERLQHDLERHGFSTVDEAELADLPPAEVASLESRVRAHDEAWTITVAALAEAQFQDLPSDPVDLSTVGDALRVASEEYDQASAEAGVAMQRHDTAQRLASQVRDLWAQQADDRREFDILRRLAATVHGESPNTRRLRLESYVLAVELDQIVRAANRRLAVMSERRYELLLDDRTATRGNNAGLGVRVLDQHTQEARAPESLSGGEKFLASLALALGLAEVVTERAGGVSLDTLFIDEGFGSLDVETLDLAMHALDQLREHGRTVGVISHVEAMKERIPAQLVVEPTAGGWSTVRTVV